MALNTEIRRIRLGDPRPQEVNARFMRKEQLDTLAANIAQDGRLTSVPLVFQPDGEGPIDIISGHHRIEAGILALGVDTEVDMMVVLDHQSRDEIIARQISHNAIAGEDDYATLKRLYDEIEDVDWRVYTGLDDKTLELMDQVDVSSLSEANLDFQTVVIYFLAHELEAANRAFEEAKKLMSADHRWLAAMKQYEPTLKAVETARGAHGIGNIATALSIVIDVFEAHLGDLTEAWFDSKEQIAKTQKWVPIETVAGARQLPAEAGAIIVQAMRKARRDAELEDDDQPWRGLELIAADYLAGS